MPAAELKAALEFIFPHEEITARESRTTARCTTAAGSTEPSAQEGSSQSKDGPTIKKCCG
jgi:hypothetical protein